MSAIAIPNCCLHCGRFCIAAYCCQACHELGPRTCAICGCTLHRRDDEQAPAFRKRRTCGRQCYNDLNKQRALAQWQDCVVRERMIRGLSLAHDDPQHIQRLREQMKRKWETGQLGSSARLFSAEEIRAIRSDARIDREIGKTYGVNKHVIRRIRLRRSYRKVE